MPSRAYAACAMTAAITDSSVTSPNNPSAAPSPAGPDPVCSRLGSGFIDIDQHDVHTARCECVAEFLSESSSASRDYSCLPSQ